MSTNPEEINADTEDQTNVNKQGFTKVAPHDVEETSATKKQNNSNESPNKGKKNSVFDSMADLHRDSKAELLMKTMKE